MTDSIDISHKGTFWKTESLPKSFLSFYTVTVPLNRTQQKLSFIIGQAEKTKLLVAKKLAFQ